MNRYLAVIIVSQIIAAPFALVLWLWQKGANLV